MSTLVHAFHLRRLLCERGLLCAPAGHVIFYHSHTDHYEVLEDGLAVHPWIRIGRVADVRRVLGWRPDEPPAFEPQA